MADMRVLHDIGTGSDLRRLLCSSVYRYQAGNYGPASNNDALAALLTFPLGRSSDDTKRADIYAVLDRYIIRYD